MNTSSAKRLYQAAKERGVKVKIKEVDESLKNTDKEQKAVRKTLKNSNLRLIF